MKTGRSSILTSGSEEVVPLPQPKFRYERHGSVTTPVSDDDASMVATTWASPGG